MKKVIKRYLGVRESALAWLVCAELSKYEKLLLVTPDSRSAEALAQDLRTLQNQRPVNLLTTWETLPFEDRSPSREIVARRVRALESARFPGPSFIVSSAEALVHRCPTPWFLDRLSREIQSGEVIERDRLLEMLFAAGYRHSPIVEEIGDISVRGKVIDIFSGAHSEPIRLHLNGNKVHEIRAFNVVSQRTLHRVESVRITPVSEHISLELGSPFEESRDHALTLFRQRVQELGTPPSESQRLLKALDQGNAVNGIELIQAILFPDVVTIFDHLSTDATILLYDPHGIEQSVDEMVESYQVHSEQRGNDHYLVPQASSMVLPWPLVAAQLNSRPVVLINDLESSEQGKAITIRAHGNTEVQTKLKTAIGSGAALKPLFDDIDQNRRQKNKIAFFAGSDSRAERLQQILLEGSIDAPRLDISPYEWCLRGFRPEVAIFTGHLNEGVRLLDKKLVFYSETELFGERSFRDRGAHTQKMTRRLLNTLSQLKEGDYVVHTDYGIGIYHGIQHLNHDDITGDYLHIEYLDSRLYLPVHNISKIQKYSAAEGQTPRIDKLASMRWKNTKARVRQSVISIAGELIRLYATRSVARGWRFEPIGAEDHRFAEGFAFNETVDQLRAIEETLNDMAAERPMDRLICGDVGFGKTEVALRAAFKCTQHARQVAVLVPTTILVEQHRSGFERRFTDFPVSVGAVSRFYSPKKNRETLQALERGEIDVIIGTHRLIQSDVIFKDLGLVIVDEEHRFGVKQKERLKQIKKQVDVLTLTATPIPRTLHMSLLGIRDVSVINTAPHNRRVVQTSVATFSDELVRDAILREIDRGGQAFYLHNRVQSIDVVCARLSQLVPEARFGFAHGQMSEEQLEAIMLRFLNHEIDVLISTTIIESGLDIPNANTMIVERADALGLAQLYQIRGRVGRSTRQAYCYLLVPKQEKLGTEARQRLTVLQSLDDLGIGFQLALRDLEIRGAGNLLGKEQSGNVAAIGFELYTKILKEAVLHLKGERPELDEEIDPEVSIPMSSFIPEDYIPDISERLIMYQRLSTIVSADDVRDMHEELEDRFGRYGPELQNLIELMKLKSALKVMGVHRLELKAETMTLGLSSRALLDGAKLATAMVKEPEKIRLSKQHVLTIRCAENRFFSPADIEAFIFEFFERFRGEAKTTESGTSSLHFSHE